MVMIQMWKACKYSVFDLSLPGQNVPADDFAFSGKICKSAQELRAQSLHRKAHTPGNQQVGFKVVAKGCWLIAESQP